MFLSRQGPLLHVKGVNWEPEWTYPTNTIVARSSSEVWSELLRLSNKHGGRGPLPPRLEQKR
jgi:hypothetical protein